ncbi:MAG: hypothetical protein RI907_3701 [Pseudomonadota bacterium]
MASTLTLSPQELRAKLMAPKALDRVHALHALEREADHADVAFARELHAFTARGIPYYAPEDEAYQQWVDKAVAYWSRLHEN